MEEVAAGVLVQHGHRIVHLQAQWGVALIGRVWLEQASSGKQYKTIFNMEFQVEPCIRSSHGSQELWTAAVTRRAEML